VPVHLVLAQRDEGLAPGLDGGGVDGAGGAGRVRRVRARGELGDGVEGLVVGAEALGDEGRDGRGRGRDFAFQLGQFAFQVLRVVCVLGW
jgi:hypothetical protein